jgi:ATP-dependent exoDNAse (exonuclease V) beta subunit
MGTEDDPFRPYYVPFSPLFTNRKAPSEPVREPHLEFVFGVGEDAENARPFAARALAFRLTELKEQDQIRSWDEVALLFRASTGYPAYEAAFEDANIPFVTIAGRGFYDRPEIRDVLNILRSLADPSDDLVMAGMLRSPAFGLTDTALYQLRWQTEIPAHYWIALQADLNILGSEDQLRATRALSILNGLLPLVDRIPVAELLKKVVDATDYRAILAVGDQGGNGGRLWRNLDKLMVDAQTSGEVNVRDFLDYLTTINDAGAREGEAPSEAQGSVRLMTIHSSKGLQFPIVVLADASRDPKGGNKPAILLPNLGLAFKLDPVPMLFRLAKQEDQRQEEAEKQRLLYVALTRAQEKLIISGHLTAKKTGGVTSAGYLKELVEAAGFDLGSVVDNAGTEVLTQTSSGQTLRAWVMPDAAEAVKLESGKPVSSMQEAEIPPIYMPLAVPTEAVETEDESTEIQVKQVTVPTGSILAGVIGQLVHKAIELWLLPDDPRLKTMLESAALNAGLAQKSQRTSAVSHAVDLLARMKDHPLRKEIEAATEIHHELPYSRMVKCHAETGYIDLMYLSPTGWKILDFKTDSIRSTEEGVDLIRRYSSQMRKYASAVETLMGQKVQLRICFLDDRGKVELVKV